MKDLRPIRRVQTLRQWIAQGEHEQQDFKYTISDARKIARSISAFANNAGGRLLIGVKDNGTIAGVRNEEDIYVIEQAASRYCAPPHHVEFQAYKAEGGIHVIVATIDPAPSRPVCVIESDGTHRAYYRVADQNIAASPLMVRAWRRAAAHDAPPLTLRPIHTAILDLLRQGPITDERSAAIALHTSIAATTDALEALAAANLVTFRHNGSNFAIHQSDQSDQ